MSLADVVGSVSYEVVAAASLAAASVAAAAVYSGRGGRRVRQGAGAHLERSESGADEAEVENEDGSEGSPRQRNKRRKLAKKARKKAKKLEQQQEEYGDEMASHSVDTKTIGSEPTSKQAPQELPSKVVVEELKANAEGKWKDKIVYTFLDDKGQEAVNYTLSEIDLMARKVAATLQKEGNVNKGDRVMLCYPPGLDFAIGFWGCLYAGAIGIPVYPPYPGTLAKDLPKFNRMVEDSGARVILTNRTYYLASQMATVKGYFSRDKTASTTWPENVKWFSTDSISDAMAAKYSDVPLSLDDVAFFQYSSGSTSAPKAVMITHGNLRAQLKTWESILPSDTMISWLPSYHDMGLVGFIISPAVFGARCVSMSPISFIKDPAMWMRIVSKYKATHVCAPNFGYALAARKTTDAAAAKMDLSTLKQTICAAEPIRRESLESFTNKFKVSGFDPKTFNCGYGLAEVTLVCTGQNPYERKMPTVLALEKSSLEAHRQVRQAKKEVVSCSEQGIMTLVGCGKPMPTFSVAIVDPDTRQQLKEMEVGEIWIKGPSVAKGYWNRPEYTEQMFRATIAGEEQSNSTYLRSGDMGFLYQGELFVTGRLKDLIIIRGRNVCPQDVEVTVEQAHEYVRPGCVAAFSIERDQEEHLVVVAEVRNASDKTVYEEICGEITRGVLTEHQLKCDAIVLLRQKAIPKTTSGKIQRSASKDKFVSKSLSHVLFEYRAKDHGTFPVLKNASPSEQAQASPNVQMEKPASLADGVKSPEEILQWLVDRIANEVGSASGEPSGEGNRQTPSIDPATPWASYGLDSVAIVSLSAELGEFLGCVVPPSAFFQFDSPLKLANAPGLATGDMQCANEDGPGCEVQQASSIGEIDPSCYEIEHFPEVQYLMKQMKEFQDAGMRVPYLETLTAEKRKMVNFNTYNYLGHASHQETTTAAKKAIDAYGTTMSSSPIVGQTQVNEELEAALCKFFGAEGAILYVGGWVANVTTIDALVSKGDLILCDALNHDSCVTGQRLSGATVLPFPHNDTDALERMLSKIRMKYRRVLIVIEGVYSMDGDIPNLPEMIRIKQKYKAMLFLDEAHSFGTMGTTGRGLVEHFNLDPSLVDIRMGTMSKALGSVGGFMLGSHALIKYLKHCAGGFVFSVGLAPAQAAAALKSVQMMLKNASRTRKLQDLSSHFYDLCKERNLPVGSSVVRGAPVVVVIIGSTIATAKASQFLAEKGNVNVKPIVHPAVEEGKCRLRFFISALHTKQQLEHTADTLATYLKQLDNSSSPAALSA